MQDLVPAIIVVGLASVIGWILRTISNNRRRQRLAEIQAGIHRDLLQRFGSAQELLTYLGSDTGRELVRSTTMERPNPFGRILGAIQAGIVLTLVGVALVAWVVTGRISEPEGFTFLATLCIAVGLGFLGSAFASWTLARRWGLVATTREDGAA